MMRSVKCTVPIAVTVASLLMAVGCTHKDLIYESSHIKDVEVRFDWSDAPDAIPESMSHTMFAPDGRIDPVEYIFSNRTGGHIHTADGAFSAIAHNADINDWARFSGKSDIESYEISTAEATALTASGLSTRSLPKAVDAETEPVYTTPQMLWCNRVDGINIDPADDYTLITMRPHEAVCHYTVDVYDVENIQSVAMRAVDFTLSGLACSYMVGQDCPSNTSVSVTGVMTPDSALTKLHSEFLTFGKNKLSKSSNILTLYLIIKDGSRWSYQFDVTDQIDNAPDPHNVHIVVRGIELPTPISGDGTGLLPDVDDWHTVIIGLPM